ncbi:MAG: site-2 protease family protein, partial [Planctomycetales bacterium]
THEMGHFLQAVRYGVPASFPYFLPMPLNPIGTMGAVIGMQGTDADRKELFDIGLTGPLAGLVVALPITFLGLSTAQPVEPQTAAVFGNPLLWDWMVYVIHGPLEDNMVVPLNPLATAGWVGLFLTGLNMLPISQLDGGHVSYALLGSRSFWLARGVMALGVAYTVYSGYFAWVLMLLLLFLIGPTHPPTANDKAPMGTGRIILGYVSLFIPVLCFTPEPLSRVYLNIP